MRGILPIAAAKLIEAGMSQREVAKALGISHTTVQRDMNQNVSQNDTERVTVRDVRGQPSIAMRLVEWGRGTSQKISNPFAYDRPAPVTLAPTGYDWPPHFLW
jgi:hypothetical protein